MKVLLIDVLSSLSDNKNLKTFFTLLDLIEKAEEMATNFANK